MEPFGSNGNGNGRGAGNETEFNTKSSGTGAEGCISDAASCSTLSIDAEEDAELVAYQEALHNLEQQRDAVSAAAMLALLILSHHCCCYACLPPAPLLYYLSHRLVLLLMLQLLFSPALLSKSHFLSSFKWLQPPKCRTFAPWLTCTIS